MSGARLDQHFLTDLGVRDLILAAAGLSATDRVLEIGPGRGILTRELLKSAGTLVAVEIDERLFERLKEELKDESKLKLVRADFLTLDLASLGPGPFKIVANLPYAVASPILQKLLVWPAWTSAVLMFQKEVAERVAAQSGSKYGLLSLSVKLYAEASVVMDVSREAFRPRPQVASAVVRLVRHREPALASELIPSFFRVAKAAFSERRKMTAGLIARSLGIPRLEVEKHFAACAVKPTARAEEIPFAAYLELARRIAVKDIINEKEAAP